MAHMNWTWQRTALAAALAVTLYGNLRAATTVNGTVYDGSGGPWTPAGSPYLVNDDVSVPAGRTLTIQPSVVVKFVYGSQDLIVSGTLSADGTPGARIIFTSDKDDTAGGDSNGDGTASGPYAGIWGCLRFTASSSGSLLDNVEVRYAGWASAGGVWVEGGQLTLTNSLISYSDGSGVRIETSAPTLAGNTYAHNTWAAVAMDLASSPALSASTLTDNRVNGLALDSGNLVGNRNWDDVDLVHVIFGDITVPAGQTLTLAAGLVVKAEYGANNLIVNGTLLAAGSAAAPIRITSLRDDSVGGDTNNDAANSGPYAGIWGTLYLGPASTGNSLNHVDIRYGGWSGDGNLKVNGGQLTLANSVLASANGPGLRLQQCNPVLTDNTFASNSGAAASMDLASNPDIHGVTVNGNGTNGLVLDPGTLAGGLTWDDPDIVYVFFSTLTVPAGATLTIAAGQVVKVGYGAVELRVDGTLIAAGTGAAPVEFTSYRDDTVGGNTNGTADEPYRGIWGGLLFGSTSSANSLQHCRIAYGGWGTAGSLVIDRAGLTLADSSVRQCNGNGIRIAAAAPVLQNTTFADNSGSAVSMDLGSNPDIHGVTVANNGVNGLSVDPGTLPTDGFWDDPDITYRLSGDVTVPPGRVLTVAPGQVVKLAYGECSLLVRGTLLADGTAAAPIVFTSDHDDSVGGDTNNNGTASTPWAGIWGRIRFESTGAANVLTNVHVLYPGWGATAGIEVDGAPLTMTDCTVHSAGVYGLRLQSCAPQLTRTTFDSNAWAAISANLAAAPVIAGVTLEHNGQNGLRLDSGVLPGDAVWDDTDIVHILSGDLTVPAAATLTLKPGLIVKAQYGAISLVVHGTLAAAGTAAAPIVITSDRDDSVGGDTNNGTSEPFRGVWGGLLFTPSAVDCILDHTEVRYGGWGIDAAVLVEGCSARVRNGFVTQCGNSGVGARNGAGIDLENTVLAENNGNGLFAVNGSAASLTNCTVDRNSTGVYTDAATAVVSNSLITGHSSAGLYRAGSSAMTVRYCDVYNPGAGYGNYRDLDNRTGTDGNLSADPLYAGKGTLAYRLQEGSPAIDAAGEGAPTHDYLGLLRYDHPGKPNAIPERRGDVDMGAFEYNGIEALDIDLVTSRVAGPATGPQDGTIQVTWTVNNTGSADAEGAWYDVVYLSADSTLSADDRLIGSLQHSAGLAAGASYDAALDILLQGVVPGSFHFLVFSDARQETREGGSQSNNAAASTDTTSFTMPQLTLGVPTAGSFASVGERQYYQVLVPTGSNLVIRLDDADHAGLNELCLNRGTPPSATSAQYAASGAADPRLSVPAAPAGTWYVQVHNALGTGAYTLLAEVTHVGLYTAVPGALGNGADMVLTLSGAGFVTGTSASLVSETGSVYPGAVRIDSFSRLAVTFPAASVPAGVYTIRVSTPAGESAALASAFAVLPGGTAALETHLVLPAALGYHQLATLYVTYNNTGSVAMPAPLLTLSASQDGREAALLTLDALRVSAGFWTSATPEGFAPTVQFLASGATPGVLQPGESGRVAVYWAGWLQPWNFAYPPISFRIGITHLENATPVGRGSAPGRADIGWDAYRDALRPAGVQADGWNALWSVFARRVGTTWGDYVAMLNRSALYLGGVGDPVGDVQKLLAFELLQADGLSPLPVLASARDADTDTPVLALSFERSFPNSVTGRYRLGALGRGWTHPWEASLMAASDGTVRVYRPGAGARVFQPDARGGYSSAPGDYGRLTALDGGAFLLSEKDGRRSAFTASGAADYVEEPNGNRVTGVYTAGRLTALNHSCGRALTLTYTAAGRIASVTDPEGRRTTFAYDATGEHLLTATRPDGQVVAYSYGRDTGGPTAHALTEIAFPGGSHRTFTYDADGRCSGTYRDGNAEPLQFSYPGTGTVRLTDGRGNSSTLQYDHCGYLVRSTDPLGQGGLFQFDGRGQLTGLADNEGRRVDLSYDGRGNLTRVQDALGQPVSFAYAGPQNRLAAVTDAAGKSTLYTCDSRGNQLSMTQEGTTQRYAYDRSGLLSNWTNPRGQVAALTYDSAGRLQRRDHPDAADADLVYDGRGNLTSVTDATGTTTMTYSPNDLLTRVGYPGGRTLEFTYDAAGRRASMTDQLGNPLYYEYDAVGRLRQVRDGTPIPVVTYTYDASGRIASEELGNGTRTDYTYAADGKTTSIIHRQPDLSVLSQYSRAYNGRSLCSSETSAEGTWTYTYDTLDRLVTATFDSAAPALPDRALTYSYDAVGNRTRVTVNGTETAYASNARNQVTQAGATTFLYDADGNLSRADGPAGTTTYTYDSLDRLTAVISPAGAWTYTYNAFGDRVAETARGVTTRFVLDPLAAGNLVAAYDDSGALLARYEYGAGLVRRSAGGDRHYYHHTPSGNTGTLSTATGTPANRYVYDPFGNPVHESESIPNPFKFGGRWGVVDEGNGLHLMRARHYRADLGRFISTDPERLPPWGLYTYCDNDSVNLVDPSGLSGTAPDDPELLSPEDVSGVVKIARYLNLLGPKRRSWLDTALDRVFGSPKYSRPIPQLRPRSRPWHEGLTFLDLMRERKKRMERFSAGDIEAFEPVRSDGSPATPPEESPSSSTGGEFGETRPPTPPADSTTEGDTGSSGPRDPNAKLGPAGTGSRAYVSANQTLPYRIDFENDAAAGAPAQYVAVRDQLSGRFDWATFELTEIGFGDRVFAVPAGQQSYGTVVPMTYLGTDFEVHIQVGLDPATGLIQTDLYSLDPATGLPPPVEIGFLPPEDGSGRGKGYVAYVIRPQSGLASGTEIRNVATITFDFGEVIATNQVDPHDPAAGTDPAKEALVTIDASAPVSAVTPLPAQSRTGFEVSWSGTDTGAGIAAYTVYVSQDGGPFVPWLSDTSLTTAAYPGSVGHTYGFYVLATDATGHTEPAKTVAEATTTVVYAVTFAAAANGTLVGSTAQHVPAGASTTPVEAVPDTGYHFVRWTSGGTYYSFANPLTVAPVSADLACTAEFAINIYTVSFVAGTHGTLSGAPAQAVAHGGNATAVSVLPAVGYVFEHWSDGSTENPRTLTAITASVTLTASFRVANPVAPSGTFQAVVATDGGAAAPAWWDLSGDYTATVAGQPLRLSLVHDASGALTGTATYTPATAPALTVPVKGSVRGSAGQTVAKLSIRGTDAAGRVSLALTLNLTVNAATHQLRGRTSGRVTNAGTTTPVAEDLTLLIPAPMDGTWTLRFTLASPGTAVTGTALLRLANGADYACVVRGRRAGTSVVLNLTGDPLDPAARDIRMRTRITPIENGDALLESFSGRGYGQTLNW